MPCNGILPYLDGFRTGELAPDLHRAVTAHIEQCPMCRKELQMIQTISTIALGLVVSAPNTLLTRVREALSDRYGVVETDLGLAWIGFTQSGISMVQLNQADNQSFERFYEKRLGRRPTPGPVPQSYSRAVRQALLGQKLPKAPPISLDGLSTFEQDVLRQLARIPLGEVRPYAWLAKEAGNPKAVRAVGTIMARNPVPFLLPCHRIVPSGGGVGNYGFGPEMKRTLLEREGVSVKELDTLERQKIRYMGSRTTGIFCYPTCHDARRINWENQVTFSDAREAQAKGYRPCKHCKPLVETPAY